MTDPLLAIVVRLLPARHRDWGVAMRAETAALPPGLKRWAHTLGCAGAVLAQPAALRAVGCPLAALAVLGVVLRWSAGIADAPLRWALVGAVALLLTVACLGRTVSPVGPGAVARAVRAGVAALAATVTGLAPRVRAPAGTAGPVLRARGIGGQARPGD
ncbi:hypothetical protein AB0H83_19390 [Dactylosporangium sp. NPDC050688]|uniref:hypothetical protein n=1 Tax=Dactylosporangium sp. NPDC050688 TaxID=3157217 RepID=UPI003411EC8D